MEVGGEHRDTLLLLSIPKPLLLSLTAHTFCPKDQFIAQNRDMCISALRRYSQCLEHTRIPDTDVRVPGP